MPIRVQMPNGTVRPFREGTPKSVIRRAIADMLADMKASGDYDGFDFSAFERKPRKVEVTQFGPTRTLRPDEIGVGPGATTLWSALQKKAAPVNTVIPKPNPIREAEAAGRNKVIWSDERHDPGSGQTGSDEHAAGAIQYAYANGKGQDYWVDPKVMKLENSIDLSDQVQKSIDSNGYMRGILEQSLKTGEMVPFNSKDWHQNTGLTRFQDDPRTAAGKSVGRYGGDVDGYLWARPDGTYTVMAKVKIVKDNPYSWNLDGEDLWKNLNILAGSLQKFNNDGHDQPYFKGDPMHLNFTRDATVYANGTFK